MGRTKKVGVAGSLGVRYGRKVRSRLQKVGSVKKFVCPDCKRMGMKREVSGIWSCKRCGLKLAGKAYRPE